MNRLLCLGTLAAASVGCSFTLAKSPPQHIDKGSFPECGTPGPALVGDVVLSTVVGLAMVSAARQGNTDALMVSAPVAALFLGSTAWGVTRDRACEQARAQAMTALSVDSLVVRPPAPAPPPVGGPR